MADDARLDADLALDNTGALASVAEVKDAVDEATSPELNVGGADAAGGATASVTNLGNAAEKTQGQVLGATNSTQLLGGAGAIASGQLGGVSKVVDGIGLGSLGAVAGVGALTGAINSMAQDAIEKAGALYRFQTIVGDFADQVENVNVGTLTGDLGELANKLGSDDEAMQSAAASTFQLGKNTGLTGEQSADFAEKVSALALRARALKPSLGEAGQIAEMMGMRLGRGGAFAARLQVNLTATEISAKAAELGLKGVNGTLSAGEKSYAAAVVAAEKYGATMQKDVADGAKNPIIQQASLREAINNLIEDAGQPIVMPFLDLLRAGTPIVGALAKVLSALAQGALPALSSAAEIVAPPLEAIADAIGFLQPLIGPLTAAWLAYITATMLIPPLMALVGGSLVTVGTMLPIIGSSAVAAGAGMEVFGAASAASLGPAVAIGVGITALGTELGLFGDNADSGATSAEKMTKALDGLSRATSQQLVDRFHALVEELSKPPDSGGFFSHADELFGIFSSGPETMDESTASLKAFRQIAEQNVGTGQRLIATLESQGEATGKYRKIIDDVLRGRKQEASDTNNATNALDGNTNATDANVDANAKLSAEIDKTTNAVLGLWSAQLQLADSLASADEKYAKYKEALAGGDATKIAATQRDLEQGIIGAAEAAGKAATEDLGPYATELERSIANHNAQIYALELEKQKYPELAPVIQAHIDKLNAIPPVKATDIYTVIHGTEDVMTKLREIQAILNAIGTAPTDVDSPQPGGPGTYGAQHGRLVPGRGNEMVPILAHAGERVLSKDEARSGWGGGTVVHSTFAATFNAPIYGVEDLEREISRMQDQHDAELERSLRVLR